MTQHMLELESILNNSFKDNHIFDIFNLEYFNKNEKIEYDLINGNSYSYKSKDKKLMTDDFLGEVSAKILKSNKNKIKINTYYITMSLDWDIDFNNNKFNRIITSLDAGFACKIQKLASHLLNRCKKDNIIELDFYDTSSLEDKLNLFTDIYVSPEFFETEWKIINILKDNKIIVHKEDEFYDYNILGLNLANKMNEFKCVIDNNIEIFEDLSLHKQMRNGVYGWLKLNFINLSDKNTFEIYFHK